MRLSVVGGTKILLPDGWSTQKVVSLFGEMFVTVGTPAPDAVLTLFSAVGAIHLSVPSASQVALEGFSVVGSRTVNVAAGSGPAVRVSASTILGSVDVTERA
jgi:hypothetical protein